jgi:hypothetical protein
MITCQWMGRLGNNMFQIAVTLAIALKYGEKAEFLPFPYFGLPQRTCNPENTFVQPIGRNDVLDIPNLKNLNLIGFWQRHEYFDHIKELLVKEVFKVPADWQPNTIGVHVRRGDFVQDTENFPMQPISYYMQALEALHYKNKQVVFCSDDIDWCKKNFPFAQFRENTDELDDIYFLANCDAVIMSNSTFSFWGAYLNLRQRPVYFPLHWFSYKSGRDGYEICPKEWIGL